MHKFMAGVILSSTFLIGVIYGAVTSQSTSVPPLVGIAAAVWVICGVGMIVSVYRGK